MAIALVLGSPLIVDAGVNPVKGPTIFTDEPLK